MVLGYLVVRLVDRVCGTKTSTWLALTVGMVPDIDLAFAWSGIEHHTYTHSLVFWLPFIVFVFWRKEYVAAYVGILQHMLDDMLVGPVPILLPLSPLQVGFRFGVPSIVDTVLELSALLVAASVAYLNGDIRKMLSIDRSSMLNLIPLFILSSSTLIASREFNVVLLDYAFSSRKLTLISIAHLVLAGFLGFSGVRGIQGLAQQTGPSKTELKNCDHKGDI
jgi:hypothetical protein